MTTPAAAPLIDGAALLDQVEAFHRRFNVFPSEAAYVAVVLWDAHTHLLDAFESTPRLAFLSPEPGSGKTRALEIVETLTPRPLVAVNATPAALFRAVNGFQGGRPTILFDEIDTVFGPKAGGNEELRGLFNAGHRRTGVTWRCVGDNAEVTPFYSYAALAMGGLGDLPDTIMARSVVIRMRRRAPNEKVEPFRQRLHEAEGNALRDQLTAWADQIRDQVEGAFPAMPEGIKDRPADVWEPLLAVADAAGGNWPDRARAACVELVNAAKANDKGSEGVRLLTDLRQVFGGAHALPTATILNRLLALDESPWADLDGRPLDARGLARRLREYVTSDNEPIRARNVRTGAEVAKGYYATDLHDAWTRYCPPPLLRSATAVTDTDAPELTSTDAVAEAPSQHPDGAATSATPLRAL